MLATWFIGTLFAGLLAFVLAGWWLQRFTPPWLDSLINLGVFFLLLNGLLCLYPFPALGRAARLRLTRRQQPRLFNFMDEISRRSGQQFPAEVSLVMQLNAGVGKYQNGWQDRRHLEIGLPLLNLLSLAQFRAVLLHELAHLALNHLDQHPWIWLTNAMLYRSRRNWWVVWWFWPWIEFYNQQWGYLQAWGYLTSQIAHATEFIADWQAARLGGSIHVTESLQRLHAANELVERFMKQYSQFLDYGYRLPLSFGLAHFLTAPEVVKQMDQALLEQQRLHADAYRFLDHPTLGERTRAVQPLPPGQVGRSPGAIRLLDDVAEMENILLIQALGRRKVRKLRPLTWAEAGETVLAGNWQRYFRRYAAWFGGWKIGQLTDLARSPQPLVQRLNYIHRYWTVDEINAELDHLGETALALALRRQGWRMVVRPGEAVILRRRGCEIKPYEEWQAMRQGKLDRVTWQQRCAELRIQDQPLIACD